MLRDRVFRVLAEHPNGPLTQLDPESGILWLMGDLPAAGVHSVEPDPGTAEPAFRAVSNDQGYLVSEGERPVLFYQSAPPVSRRKVHRELATFIPCTGSTDGC